MKPVSRIEVIENLVVHRCDPASPRQAVVGARLARLGEKELLCTFMMQHALGKNDFMPVACRSNDLGRTWSAPKPLWPNHSDYDSLFGSISPQPDARGRLILYGLRCPVDTPGEGNWQVENFGLKQTELFYATSDDRGQTWSAPIDIRKPTVGSAEAPGALCITQSGRWLVCYSVYNSFDKSVHAPHQELWALRSDDEGRTWQSSLMMRGGPNDGTAESWVIELTDGRLLGACWHMCYADGKDYPTPYVISSDGGVTWSQPQPIGVNGQTIALAPLPDGRAILLYNQRRADPIGVHMAILEPDGDRMRIVTQAPVWRASVRKQNIGGDDSLDNWTDFAFGEPSALVLSEHEAFVVLWSIQPDLRGIPGVRVHIP